MTLNTGINALIAKNNRGMRPSLNGGLGSDIVSAIDERVQAGIAPLLSNVDKVSSSYQVSPSPRELRRTAQIVYDDAPEGHFPAYINEGEHELLTFLGAKGDVDPSEKEQTGLLPIRSYDWEFSPSDWGDPVPGDEDASPFDDSDDPTIADVGTYRDTIGVSGGPWFSSQETGYLDPVDTGLGISTYTGTAGSMPEADFPSDFTPSGGWGPSPGGDDDDNEDGFWSSLGGLLVTALEAPFETFFNVISGGGFDPEGSGDDLIPGDWSRMLAGKTGEDAKQPPMSVDVNTGALIGAALGIPVVGSAFSPTYNYSKDGTTQHGGDFFDGKNGKDDDDDEKDDGSEETSILDFLPSINLDNILGGEWVGSKDPHAETASRDEVDFGSGSPRQIMPRTISSDEQDALIAEIVEDDSGEGTTKRKKPLVTTGYGRLPDNLAEELFFPRKGLYL